MHHAKPILMLDKGSSAHSFIMILSVMKTQTGKLPLLVVTSHPPPEGLVSCEASCEPPCRFSCVYNKEAFADNAWPVPDEA